MNRHEKRKLRTRNKLKEAALELLLSEGYEKLSVQEITDRADLGRGTFYVHFDNKSDVVWSIVKDGIEAEDRAAHLDFSESMPPQAEFYGYVRMFRHAAQNRDLYLVMLGARGSSTLTGRVQDYLAREFEEEMQDSPIYRDLSGPPKIVAQIVTGAVVRLIIWWLQTDNDYTADQMAAILYEALHHKTAPLDD
jgi:AcrR family transcriptional regulator